MIKSMKTLAGVATAGVLGMLVALPANAWWGGSDYYGPWGGGPWYGGYPYGGYYGGYPAVAPAPAAPAQPSTTK